MSAEEATATTLLENLKGCDRLVALLGAPNTGKSVLYNTLTKGKSSVANWPGVTVDLHIGRIRTRSKTICILDLPGAYGLVPSSPEENVTLEALLELKPHLIVALLDSTNPDAGINLVVQAIEAFDGRVIVALTKHALAHAMGVHIDIGRLQALLGAPVVPVSALEGLGLDKLLEFILGEEQANRYTGLRIDYGFLEEDVKRLENNEFVARASREFSVTRRWLALQIIGKSEAVLRVLERHGYSELVALSGKIYERTLSKLGVPPEVYIAEKRLAFIEQIMRDTVVRRTPASNVWQRISNILLHPVAGPIASILGLFATFGAVFSVNTGFPLNILFDWLGWKGAAEFLDKYNLSALLIDFFNAIGNTLRPHIPPPWNGLIADGVIGGVGFVLSFLPLIILVYFSLGILEDSGIATRMAISFHPLFYRFGLSGRSVFPLMLGLGCNVPAEFATRGLPEEERFRAVFAVPFIPCQARLAVIIAITSILIKGVVAQTLAVTVIYTEALLAALMTAWIASRIIQPRIYKERGLPYEAKPELIMELPPVHRPHPKVIWWYIRDNTIHFLRKAGTVIFLLAIITWGLLYYGPNGYTVNPAESYGGIIGEWVGDLTHLIGVSEDRDQILGVALLDGLIAKEGVLTAIAISTGVGQESLQTAIESLGLTASQALGFLVLITLYFPCIATLAAMKSIVKSWKPVLGYAVYSILVAIVFATVTYHIAALLAGA
ncbi:MAG: ferrous iron transport protein B [Desulfurococcales archaeon]|nr:ferrous iron transport protein B [Desulfurococcales archaeon]